MVKKAVKMVVRPLSASGVAVMLHGTGVIVHPWTKKDQRDGQVRRIARALQVELGPNAPAKMVEQSARSYYRVFCAVSRYQAQSTKGRTCGAEN